MAIPKAGVFAEAQAKVVSQQIIDDIENNRDKLSSSKFDGKGFCFMEVGDKKAGYIAEIFIMKMVLSLYLSHHLRNHTKGN